ncbi:hypothetical protein C1H46_013977 [Malus baccata]|uniref:Uncharacterized protein n=1 Tax=Malus baccata TaxID=106549 RepID=A0A540MNP6_MALBA|nr:hypothetical protein C1H46_013977 [Malus baccata]
MTSSTALDATPSSQFDPSTGVMLHFVDEDNILVSYYFLIEILHITTQLALIHVFCSRPRYMSHLPH